MADFLADQGLLALILRGKKRLLLGGIIAGAINAAATMALIGQVKTMIDGEGFEGRSSALVLAGLLVLILLTHVLSGNWLARFGAMEVASIRRRLAAAITATDFQRIEKIGQHKIHTVFAEDLARIVTAFGAIPLMLLNFIITVCGIAAMAFISFIHLLAILGLLTVGIAISEAFLMKRVVRYSEAVRNAMTGLYKQIEALIYGTKELKLNRAREAYFRDELFDKSVDEIYRASRLRDFFSTAYFGWSASIPLVLLCGILWMSNTWIPMDRPDMISFALILMYLRGPVISIISNAPHLAAANVSLRKMRELQLATGRVDPVAKQVGRNDGSWRELELANVGYVYPAELDSRGFELTPTSVTIRRGELLYVTGGNGTGKSTLAKVLVGLYKPSSGHVRLGDNIIDDDNLDWYRSHFSAIFSDYYLFDRAIGPAGFPLPDEQTREYLRLFGLPQRVDVTNGVFSSTDLSQGQRKRLALIAALAEDRPILLLDEWAAEQDPEFRRRFYCEILPSLRSSGRTIIAITHDDHYFHMADRVLRLDQGQANILMGKPPSVSTHASEYLGRRKASAEPQT